MPATARVWRGIGELYRRIRKIDRARKVELHHGKIENILGNAAKRAGIARTQYKCWEKAESIDARKYPRVRSKSNRVKEREGREKNTTNPTGENTMPDYDEQRRRRSEREKREKKTREREKGKILPRAENKRAGYKNTERGKELERAGRKEKQNRRRREEQGEKKEKEQGEKR